MLSSVCFLILVCIVLLYTWMQKCKKTQHVIGNPFIILRNIYELTLRLHLSNKKDICSPSAPYRYFFYKRLQTPDLYATTRVRRERVLSEWQNHTTVESLKLSPLDNLLEYFQSTSLDEIQQINPAFIGKRQAYTRSVEFC